jgi:hypothetical protein
MLHIVNNYPLILLGLEFGMYPNWESEMGLANAGPVPPGSGSIYVRWSYRINIAGLSLTLVLCCEIKTVWMI